MLPRSNPLPVALALVVAALAWAPPARADEPLFGFVYTTDLLPNGKKEVEQWVTLREKKAYGTFHLLEGRTEFSYGVTDAFQLSFYLNYAWTEAFRDSVHRETVPPETFAERFLADPERRLTASKFVGGALEGIWRILSPYTDPLGLAVLLEPTVWKDFVELETRLILQKNFLDDRLVIAFNITLAQELRELPGDPAADPGTDEAKRHWDRETDLNFGLAASYRFAPNWFAGLEFLNEREFSELIFWQGRYATNDAYYAGPTLHYGGRNFFFTLTLLEQLPFGRDFANVKPDSQIRGGYSHADDFERHRVRLKVGWYF